MPQPPPFPRTLADMPLPSQRELAFALAMGLVWGTATILITLLSSRIRKDVERDVPEVS